MSWLTKRAAELAMKEAVRLYGPVRQDDLRLAANTMMCGIEALAREFAERACEALWLRTDEVSHYCMPDMCKVFAEADKDNT